MVIYKITNPIGEIYIGKSTNVEKRWEGYKYPGDIIQTQFYDSLRKYGFENHHKEIIEENIDESLGGTREIYYIDVYDSYHNGLNMNPGGGGVGKHKPKTKKLISEARKGWKPSVERGVKIGDKVRGIPCSEEKKQKISLATKGKPKGLSGRVSPNLGNKYSDKVREGISKNRTGHKMSEETKQLMSKNQWKTLKVNQYTKEGKFIKTWDSITQAKNEVGGDVSSCVNGRQKTAGGYIWKKNNIRIDKYIKKTIL